MKTGQTDKGFERALEGFDKAYAESQPEWFEFFAPKADIFVIGRAEPIQGRDAYAENFGELLTRPRQVERLNRQMRVMGDTAVVTEHLSITQDDVTTFLRQTMIWRRGEEGWKVVHMDGSLVTDPIPAEKVTDHRQIRVLRDKLATASVQTGVAQ